MHFAKVTTFFSFFQSRTSAKGIRTHPARNLPMPQGSLSALPVDFDDLLLLAF